MPKQTNKRPNTAPRKGPNRAVKKTGVSNSRAKQAQAASTSSRKTTAGASNGATTALKVDEDRAMEYFRGLLRYIGEDPEREGLQETPARVLRAYKEHFSGYHETPDEHLAKTFTEVEGYDELVLVSDIEVFSHCEHHVVPFVGRAHVAYIPDGRVVGLSKLARVVDVFAKRLQVQEKLTAQIAGAIQEHLKPLGVAVVLQCQHFCMCYRGVRKAGSWTTTSKLHGIFLSDSAARMELLTLIGMHREIGGAGHS